MNIFMDVLGSRTANGRGFSVLSFREWNERVISAASKVEGPKRNSYKRFPSTRIPDVFDSLQRADEGLRNSEEGADAEAFAGTGRFELNHAMRLSQSLRDAPSLGKGHVEKWVNYWEKKGLFASSSLNNSVYAPLHGNGFIPLARL